METLRRCSPRPKHPTPACPRCRLGPIPLASLPMSAENDHFFRLILSPHHQGTSYLQAQKEDQGTNKTKSPRTACSPGCWLRGCSSVLLWKQNTFNPSCHLWNPTALHVRFDQLHGRISSCLHFVPRTSETRGVLVTNLGPPSAVMWVGPCRTCTFGLSWRSEDLKLLDPTNRG